ncbi:MAG: polyisoprenoid-binding protein YceI [bacterium]|jgi:polyisoprenoid-binding protein YceI
MARLSRLSFLAVLSFVFSFSAYGKTFKLDIPHSSLGFAVSHLVISKTKGQFNKFSGKADFDTKSKTLKNISISVNVASIDTDNTKRDNHLRSGDFFDAKKYPKMTFKSTKIIKQSQKRYRIIGDLTIKGKTRRVILNGKLRGIIKSKKFGTRAGFFFLGHLDRTKFGLNWSKRMETGGLIVGKRVALIIQAEVVEVTKMQKPMKKQVKKKEKKDMRKMIKKMVKKELKK